MDFMKKVNQLTEKVGEFAVGTYKTVSKKSTDLVQEAKLKLIINERINEINGIYEEIGKNVYRLFKRGEDVEDFTSNCKMIEALEVEKEELQNTLLEIKNLKKCENCNTAMDIDTTFCPSCGYKVDIKKETKKKSKKESEEVKVEIEIKDEVKEVKKVAKKEPKKEVKTETPKMVKVEIKKPATKTTSKPATAKKATTTKKATTKKEDKKYKNK